MSALDKLRQQITIGRETGTFVVLTPDEAQAIVDEYDRSYAHGYQVAAGRENLDGTPTNFARGLRSEPPHAQDDEHA